MSDLHLTPEYINEFETEERLALLFRARNSWIAKMNTAMENPKERQQQGTRRVSDSDLFSKMGVKVGSV